MYGEQFQNHNAFADFAVAQQIYGVTIRQDQIGRVLDHLGTTSIV